MQRDMNISTLYLRDITEWLTAKRMLLFTRLHLSFLRISIMIIIIIYVGFSCELGRWLF